MQRYVIRHHDGTTAVFDLNRPEAPVIEALGGVGRAFLERAVVAVNNQERRRQKRKIKAKSLREKIRKTGSARRSNGFRLVGSETNRMKTRNVSRYDDR